MEIAAVPENETDRLAALYELDILDTPPDERFNGVARLATSMFEVPIAYIALIDANRQWFKASCGLRSSETSRQVSFCSHTILQDEPLIIPDTLLDGRFYDNPLVTGEPNLRFYAGCPLRSPSGFKIATLCIGDKKPRQLGDEQLRELRDLARIAEDQLKLLDLAKIQRNLRQLKDGLRESNTELERRNAFIREVFGRYMTDEVAERVLASPAALKLGGERRLVTILMCDMRGFTPLSEKLPPEQVVDLLNRYLGAMVDVICRYQGTVDSFIGDAVLVTFGAPIIRDDDPQRAIACAIEMQNAMDRINQENRARGLHEIKIGIGINSGEVVVGNIGSEKRMKYSVIGSPVNIAARVESLTLGGQILITDHTLALAGDIVHTEGRLRVKAKGLEDCVHIHDVVGIGGEYHVSLSRK